MSRALALVALTHLRYMHSEHPFMLELASSPQTSCHAHLAAYDSSIRQVGTQRWLHELSRRRQRRQHFGTLGIINGLRAVGVGSSRAFAEAAEFDFHAPPCKRCWWLLAELNFKPTSCGLYSTDSGDWKLWRCLLGALGKDQSNSHVAAAIR